MDSDPQLFELMRTIAAGDVPRARSILAASPELTTAIVRTGATRTSPDVFLADLRHHVYRGDTALHIAAAAGQVTLVRALVAAGAVVDAQNRRRARPLHYAVDGGPGAPLWDPEAQAATVTSLVELGADTEAADLGGTTPLLRAVRNRCSSAVAALLASGADPRARNRAGSSARDLVVMPTGRSGSGSPEAKDHQARILVLLDDALRRR